MSEENSGLQCGNAQVLGSLFLELVMKDGYSEKVVLAVLNTFKMMKFENTISSVVVDMVIVRNSSYDKTMKMIMKKTDINLLTYSSWLEINSNKFKLSSREKAQAKSFFAIVVNVIYEQRQGELNATLASNES